MLHKSGARKTRVITVWLDMVGLGWGNGAQIQGVHETMLHCTTFTLMLSVPMLWS